MRRTISRLLDTSPTMAPPTRRWGIPLALTIALVAAATAPAWAAPVDERPNVLVILVDDLGYGDLSCQGATDLETPHIDRLFAEGMRLDNFYANCPVCSPTRAALLSGRYQEAVGVPGVIRTHSNNSWGYLAPEATLLPATLQKAGYRTAMFGKWHLGLGAPNTPNLRGFDHFAGFLGDMMDDYYDHRRHGVNYMRRNGDQIAPEGHATDLFTEWTQDYIAEHASMDAPSPFFVYLAYNAPHTPIQPPAAWLDRYRRKHPDVDPKRAKLAALIEHMDDGIGRVLDTLDASGLADDTLVVFTSDNGGQLNVGADNGPYRNGKQTVFEGGIRVPACARWPGRIAADSRTDVVALTMDFFPTVCHAAAIPPRDWPADLDGVDLLPVLLGQQSTLAPRDVFFSRLMPPGRIWAVRSGDYKLLTPWHHGMKSTDLALELYNLEADPAETAELSDSEPEIFAALKEKLDAHIERFEAVPWRGPSGGGPGEIERRR